jgi:glycosyltransferase involved in cell wall biosynthesis
MKIACVSTVLIPSKTANSIQVMKVCQALAQLGHQVVLIVPRPVGVPGGKFSAAGWDELAAHYGLNTCFEVVYTALSQGRIARRFFPWTAGLRALGQRPDLVYVWPFQTAIVGLLFCKPVVLEIHEPPLGRFGPVWYRIFLSLKGKKRLLSITQALADLLAEHFPPHLLKYQIVIGPNGVDLERFENQPQPRAARKELALPEKATVACTGHLYAGRGAELFLSLAEAFPQVHFLWVGGTANDVETWQKKATQKNLENITYTGFVPNADLPRYQAAADILLMPYGSTIAGSSGGNSAEICSPMKMFEYMASGRAIITSGLPVIREVLDETNAVFCPPDDFPAWRDALAELLANPKLRHDLGQRARQDSLQYTWKVRAQKTLEGFVEN